MYREMTTQVKWDNHLSEKIYINQGIQQRAKLSTSLLNATTMQYWTA
jgi:hypothetical protein